MCWHWLFVLAIVLQVLVVYVCYGNVVVSFLEINIFSISSKMRRSLKIIPVNFTFELQKNANSAMYTLKSFCAHLLSTKYQRFYPISRLED